MSEKIINPEEVFVPKFTMAEWREFVARINPFGHFIDGEFRKEAWANKSQARSDRWLEQNQIPRDVGQIEVEIDGKRVLMQTDEKDFGTLSEISDLEL